VVESSDKATGGAAPADARVRAWREGPATMVPEGGPHDWSCRSPRPGGDVIVRLCGVSKSFGELRVLKHVDLDIRRGQTTVIIGPSGTGKSVLLKHIVGLMSPDAGQVFIDDKCVQELSPAELVETRKRIGFLFQMSALFDSMKVGANVAFPLVQHTTLSPREREERVDRVLRMVGLSGLQANMPADLSGGQRKRVALARAIVLEPRLVLYDEPTTGLDPIQTRSVDDSLTERGRTFDVHDEKPLS